MIKNFFAEMMSILKNKWKLLSWIIILFIPALYGFLYTNAYWQPFKKTENLNIAIVNLDKSDESKKIVKNLQEEGKKGFGENSDLLKVNFDSKKIYENSQEVEDAVKSNKVTAALVINEDFLENLDKIKWDIIKMMASELIDMIDSGKTKVDFVKLSSKTLEILNKHKNKELVTFFNSLKHNYIAGEMTTIISNLSSYSLPIFFPKWEEVKQNIDSLKKIASGIIGKNILNIILPELKDALELLKNISEEKIFVKNYSVSSKEDGYGRGLSPFFISIALWAGSLVMLFLFKNKRNYQHISTCKHYFGKSCAWIFTSMIQSILLTSFLWIQGFYSTDKQWILYLLNMFIGISFALMIQGIGYMFRHGDIGEIIAVIILVLQLVSSSGVFPVKTEHKIFQIISYAVPFSYSIESIKQVIYGIEFTSLLINLSIIFSFAVFFIIISLILNIIFDKKQAKKTNNKTYSDYLIPMRDL